MRNRCPRVSCTLAEIPQLGWARRLTGKAAAHSDDGDRGRLGMSRHSVFGLAVAISFGRVCVKCHIWCHRARRVGRHADILSEAGNDLGNVKDPVISIYQDQDRIENMVIVMGHMLALFSRDT